MAADSGHEADSPRRREDTKDHEDFKNPSFLFVSSCLRG
ncbi:hypothetical protein CCC_02703 [Paramagnetospirillum magnetotacticum MS-1]|uniref:Uncharacterized protein n=1 Tax=Paramagnetospirillum magnetotacticum MS-1 TaxID=272627 RepID=A0A0C2YJF6_PARME|nr:hypothetical protein CCC_02703 [Paramagnetospirillum magnetotacticum MS-1]